MSDSLPVYQISDLVHEMQRLMEASYPEIWIEGELSSLSTPASGHLYFSLKDDKAQLRCAMFRARASINRYKPKVGDLVRLRGKVSVYPARGDLQCIVQYMEEAGEGLLQRRFEELKQKLNQAGMFDAQHKQSLPAFAQRIGVITSPSGAAIKDVLSTLQRRCPGIPVTIYPAVVQGDTAAQSIIQAIKDACQHQQCDVLLLCRGGGSLEDLWCFNDEQLANTIYQCPIPVVSGVGHEVDVTIADLVADVRAPTPTAAAELLSPDSDTLINQLKSLSQRLKLTSQRLFEQKAQRVDFQYQRLTHPTQQLKDKFERLTQMQTRLLRQHQQTHQHLHSTLMGFQDRLLSQHPAYLMSAKQRQLKQLAERLTVAEQNRQKRYNNQFQAISKQLHTVSPLATLERGFAVVRSGIDSESPIVRSSRSLNTKQTLKVSFAEGEAICKVDTLKHNDD